LNKILILEDNKKLAEFYKNILVSAEYEVKKSYNSFDFFDIYHDFKPDLIILDIKLNNSGMNGIEVFEKLAEREEANFKSKSCFPEKQLVLK